MGRSLAKSFVDDATIVLVFLLIVSAAPAGLSVMMFDAPGSDTPATYALAGSLMSFPFACCLAVVMSQRALKVNTPLTACVWVFLPLVNIGVGGAGLAWITLVQGGKFNG
jgi:hypothetical protein